MIVYMKEHYELKTERLRELVDQRDLSLGQLEERTGVSKSQLSLTLTGKRVNIWANTLAALATFFDVSMDYLMGLSDTKAPADRQRLPDDMKAVLEAMRGMSLQQRRQLVIIARLLSGDMWIVAGLAAHQIAEERAARMAVEGGDEAARELLEGARRAAVSGDFVSLLALLAEEEQEVEQTQGK